MTYSEKKKLFLGYDFKRIDKVNKKYEYSCCIEFAIQDLYYNENIIGVVNIIIGDINTRFSIGNGWTDYAINKNVKVEIDRKTNTWRRILKSGKKTKWKKISVLPEKGE